MDSDIRKGLHEKFNRRSTDELIEIWQTNNRVEWSDMAFDVIREVLLERLPELPPQNDPITETPDIERTERVKFNWRLPVLGAIGFGIGFALMGAIMRTIFNVVQNATAPIFDTERVSMYVGAFRGIIAGGIGGAGLGWALKDRLRTVHYSLAGAFGFGVAFALVISIDSHILSEIGRAIMRLMGGPVGGAYLSLEVELAKGLGVGVIIGSIGGLGLGLASPYNKAISSLLLGLAGIISFGNIFAFGWTIFDGNFYSAWNALGGALGGAALGLALAISDMVTGRIPQKQNLRDVPDGEVGH